MWSPLLEGVDGAMFENPSPLQQLQGAATNHKPLFPLVQTDYVVLGFVIFSVFLAAGGGIGGGGVMVPVFILISGFSTASAVALSNVTIFGGAIANLIFNITKHHPLYTKPLIDWDIILVMEPCTILGALLGSYMNKVLPTWFTTICLTFLLSFMTVKLLGKGVAMFRVETEKQRAQQIQQDAVTTRPEERAENDITEPLIIPSYTDSPCARDDLRSPGSVGSARDVAARSFRSLFRVSFNAEQPGDVEHVIFGAESPRAQEGSPRAPGTPTFMRTSVSAIPETANGDNAPATPTRANGETGNGHGPTGSESMPVNRGAQYGRGRSPLSRALSQNGNVVIPAPVLENGETADVEKLQADEARQVPLEKLAILFLLAACTITTDTFKVDLECGSLAYWAVVLSVVPVVGVITLGMRQYLLRKTDIKEQNGIAARVGEVVWTKTTTFVYPAVCSLAGVVAGMFGVGGGIVKGPLMLEMGVDPQVAAASSSTMILFTSMSASVVFWHWGKLQTDYGMVLVVTGFFFTFLGQLFANILIHVFKRRSVIVFIMGGMIGASALVMYYQTSVVLRYAVAHPDEALHLNTICHHEV